MALFNYATKEITLKIVYYGPGLSGKTTNIEYLHTSLDQARKGKLLSLSTETDRTLFFDFLPVEMGKIKDFSIRFQLYTVPGQVRYNATRRLVLKGADAVVFVADSQKDMLEPNVESFENMKENLIANDLDPEDIPIVIQYNKRDLPSVLPVSELNRQLNARGHTSFESVATKGIGVSETFQSVTKLLLKHIAKKHRIDIQTKDLGGKPEEAAVTLEAATPAEEEAYPTIEELQEEAVEAAYGAEETPSTEPVLDILGDMAPRPSGPVRDKAPAPQDYSQLLKDVKAPPERAPSPAAPAPPASERKEAGFKFEDGSIESIYKSFMSDTQSPALGGKDDDLAILESPIESGPAESEADSIKSFTESLKTPLREETKTGKMAPVPEKKDFFAEIKEPPPVVEKKPRPMEVPPPPRREAPIPPPAPAPPPSPVAAPKKTVVVPSAEVTPAEEAPSAMQNVILDEINSLSRTIRKINDSLTSLKSEMGLLSKQLEDLDRKVSSVGRDSGEMIETIRKGAGGKPNPEEIAQMLNAIKASIDNAKKKKIWLLFG